MGAGAAGAWVASGFPSVQRASRLSGQSPRPNVLFIAVDDLRPELGCYGNSFIKTPAIDRLAGAGIAFTQAYCQQAVCNPSRASLLTGLRPDSVKVWDLRVHFRETVPDVVTLPQYFRRNGYRAEAYGKIFHSPLPDRKSWDKPNYWPQYSRLYSDPTRVRLEERILEAKTRGLDEDFIRDHIRGPATEAEDCPDNRRWDGEIAEQATYALYRLASGGEPFFLAVGFFLPHLPFVPPKKYWDLYDPRGIPEAPNPFLPKGAPILAMNSMDELRDYEDFAGVPYPWERPLSEEKRRLLKHGYYASVSFIDAQIGRLLLFLERLGRADDTIVVLWGDNGWKLGEHGGWAKMTAYENDTHCPLIIRAPGIKGNGKQARGLVEFIDIYPTLCGLAGLPLPDHLQGKSLGAQLNDPSRDGKPAVFSQIYRRRAHLDTMGYACRTDHHLFVEWRNMETGEILAAELYDHRDDPLENVNLAERPDQKTVQEGLRRQLRETCPITTRPGPALMSAQSSDLRVELEFINGLDEAATIYKLDNHGARRWIQDLKPGEKLIVDTYITHPFVVESASGEFYQVCYPDYPRRQVVLKRILK